MHTHQACGSRGGIGLGTKVLRPAALRPWAAGTPSSIVGGMRDVSTTPGTPGAVVVGVDGSESSARALDWAADEAALESRPLVVAHAVDESAARATAWSGVTWVLPTPVAELDAAATEIVAAAVERARSRHPGLEVVAAPAHADVRRHLLDLSRTASLLVLGSRGRGPLSSAALGSVSAHLARHAECPLVVCRPGHPGMVHEGVVVLCDGTDTSPPVVEEAFRVAALRELPVTVVRCVADDGVVEPTRLSLEADLAPVRERHPGVASRAAVHVGDVVRVLREQPRPADLLVLGRHPMTGPRTGALRRIGHVTATAVLEHVESPVLVVPQELSA